MQWIRISAIFGSISLLALLMSWGSFSIGLVDFDSVDNWNSAMGILHGNWERAWNHHSPLLFLSQAIALGIGNGDPRALIALNIGYSLIALWILFFEIPRSWGWSIWDRILLFFAGGLSTILLFQVRGASLEPMSLCLSAGAIFLHLRQLNPAAQKSWWNPTWFLMGCLFLVSYKSIFLVPWLIFTDPTLWKRPFPLRTYASIVGCFLIPVLAMNLLNAICGAPILNELRALYGIAMGRSGRIAGALEFDFYPRLFWYFDSWWWVLLGVLGSIRLLRNTSIRPLAILALYLFVLAFLLPKAPRGILLPSQLFVVLAGATLLALFPKNRVRMPLLLVGVILQIPLVSVLHLDYQEGEITHLSRVVRNESPDTLNATVGRIMEPLIAPQTVLIPILGNEAIIATRNQTQQWLLEDAYAEIAGFVAPLPRAEKPLAQAQIPMYTHPFMHLEHCEFTGRNFDEAIRQANAMLSKPHLRLYKL